MNQKIMGGMMAGVVIGLALVVGLAVTLVKYRPEAIPILLGVPQKVEVKVECQCAPCKCPGAGQRSGSAPIE